MEVTRSLTQPTLNRTSSFVATDTTIIAAIEHIDTSRTSREGSKPKLRSAERKTSLSPPEFVDIPGSGDEEDWEDEDGGNENRSDEEDGPVDEVGIEK